MSFTQEEVEDLFLLSVLNFIKHDFHPPPTHAPVVSLPSDGTDGADEVKAISFVEGFLSSFQLGSAIRVENEVELDRPTVVISVANAVDSSSKALKATLGSVLSWGGWGANR